MESNIIIGRQPILDRESKLIGYELLFRSTTQNIADITDGRYATAKVVTDALNAVGLDDLIGNKTAFINIDKSFLMNPAIEAIPADRFIFEILEDVIVDDEIVARMDELHRKGFLFALDDFDLSDELLHNFIPIFPYLHIVKIDLMTCQDISRVAEKVNYFKELGIELLAEKVETHQEHKECYELGFHYFQGYFYAKPDIIEGQKLSPSKLTLVQIVKHLVANAESSVVEQEIMQSPEVSVNLLKYLNSASFGIKREIGSIKQAISLLGSKPLLKWITLLLYSVSDDEQKHATILMETVLLRAEIMKQLILKLGDKAEAERAYFIGLVSMLDTVLHKDIEIILSELNFDEQIKEAILHHKTLLGKALSLSKALQENQNREALAEQNETTLNCEELADVLSEAYVNVMKLTQEL